MKTLIKILTLAFVLNAQFGYSQNFEWAIGSDGSSWNSGDAVDADGFGNVYSIGNFAGTMTLGGQTFTALEGTRDLFLSKHNSSGSLEWVQIVGGNVSYDIGLSIACSGNYVYVLGFINDQTYLIKYNSGGGIVWSQSIDNGTLTMHIYQHIKVDASGNCYIAGTYDGNTTIGTTNLSSYGGTDVFLAKYNSSGSFQWVKSGGGTNFDESQGIDLDGNGDIYIIGNFRQSVNFGNINLTSSANTFSSYIVKYNSSGTEVLGIVSGGSYYFSTGGIGVDGAGNLYVTGVFTGTASFGNINITSSGDFTNPSNNRFFIAKYNNEGSIIWAKKEGIIANSLLGSGNFIKTNLNGDCFIHGGYNNIASFGEFTLTGAGSFIVKYDNSGKVLWAAPVINGFNQIRGISSDGANNVFIIGNFFQNSVFGNTTLTCTGQNIFVSKLNNLTNRISGNVFIDYDYDGIKDPGEPDYPGEKITYNPGSAAAITNSSGIYNLFSGLGNFNISLQDPPLYYNINPVYNSADFSAYGLTDNNNNFGLQPISGMNDLRITLTETSITRKGRDFTQNVTCENIGTTTQSGTIKIDYDSRLTYMPAFTNPLPSRVNLTNHSLEWDYSALLPANKKIIIINYNVPPGVSVGTALTTFGKIEPVSNDLTPLDNEQTLVQIVRASHDPNDKSVSPSGGITPQQVSNAEPLTYTIRFQNTGNDTAFTVMLLDTLSSKLNNASIEILSASHSYDFSISPQGVIRWTFNNILLPDSTTNEILSHGFIKYRLKPKNNLVIGDEIKNTAYIFFDYNEPVITNTTVTQVEASKDIQINWRSEGMFPNSDATVIQLRRAVAPYDIIKTAAGVSATPFIIPPIYTLTATVNNLLSGSYYFVIKHRNSIETWSANPVTITPNGTTYYDFTTSQSKALGNNMVQTGTVWSVYSGDINQDGIIDATDLTEVENGAANSLSGYINCDLTGDNFVDATDLAIVENNSALGVSFVSP